MKHEQFQPHPIWLTNSFVQFDSSVKTHFSAGVALVTIGLENLRFLLTYPITKTRIGA